MVRAIAKASTIAACLTVLGSFAPASGQCQYQVTIIPEAPCLFGMSMGPNAINRHGHVVGGVNCAAGGNPVAWYGGPQLTFLPLPPGYVSGEAYDINDADEICGNVAVSNGLTQACVWRNGQPTLLGIPAGGNYSKAQGINNNGEICGYWGNSSFGNPALRACLWRDGQRTDLVLPFGIESAANDINDDSQIAGWMGNEPNDFRAYRWSEQLVEDLGSVPGGYTGEARAISDNGTVAGFGLVEAKREQPLGRAAAIWHGVIPTSVPPLPMATRTFLWDITDFAAIGNCAFGVTTNHPFIYQAGVLTPLSALTPGAAVTFAEAINVHGVIAAWVETSTTGSVSALLTPIGRSIGDITSNCVVNVDDLLAVISHWHESDSVADLNEDGTVNVGDLLIVIVDWDL